MSVKAEDIQPWIERFERGGDLLRTAVDGVTAAEAVSRPGPGDWSIHELVIHLADSDAIVIDRMKRLLTEDNPTLLNADESAYVQRLHPHQQSLTDAVLLFDVNRRQFARVLRCLPESAFGRYGTHNVRGRVTLAELVKAYCEHLDYHLDFLQAKKARLAQRQSTPPKADRT